ncbi:unnamed protein product [Prorocentrum cordatum]|uniref:Uncharacterized protein n=1 Tax=Prorocentrum cordatum TaxID=2364126 RepID=A0ABN9TE67_9DINO|nr:unnamed protein product [Polarella glacialis]
MRVYLRRECQACAAALATLEVLEQEKAIRNARRSRGQLMTDLRSLGGRTAFPVADARGIRLLVAIEFDREATGRCFASEVPRHRFDRGVPVLPMEHRGALRIIPPLTVSADEVQELSVSGEAACSVRKVLESKATPPAADASASVQPSPPSVQWLLAAMKFSGAFEDVFVDQVQVVAYLHDWQPNSSTGGEFVYWSGNVAPRRVKPEHGVDIDPQKSSPLDMALAILDNVIKYPLPTDVYM